MSRLGMLGIVGVAALVLTASGSSALGVRLAVRPASPHALERAAIALRTYLPLLRADGSCCRIEPGGPERYPFRVQAVSPKGEVLGVRVAKSGSNIWKGTIRFPSPGRWQVRVANYGPLYRSFRSLRPRISLRVRPAVPTPSPEGFAPLGQPGCNPPSPRNPSTDGFPDVFGTAVGRDELWALPFLPVGASWARTDAAVFDGLAGKEVKIVFGMTSFHAPFQAVAANGATVSPVWGPTFHSSSNWERQPGVEWGAGFVFPEPGCWRIRVGSFGDLWLLVRS